MDLSFSRTVAPLHGDSIPARPRSVAVQESNCGLKRPTCWPMAGTFVLTLLQHYGADAADGSRVLKRCASCSAARAVRRP